MPKSDYKPAAYYMVKKGTEYHVHKNDGALGTPTGRVASTFEEGQKIIYELEARDKERERASSRKDRQESHPKREAAAGDSGASNKAASSSQSKGKEEAQPRWPGTPDPSSRKSNIELRSSQRDESSKSQSRSSQKIKSESEVAARHEPKWPGAAESKSNSDTSAGTRNRARTSTSPSPLPAIADERENSRKSILRDCAPENADKAKRLFQFLRALTQLRSPIVRTLEKYTDVIWFSDMPRAHGCFSVFDIPEDERSELLFRVEQPRLKPPPSPPAEIAAWVDYEQLKQSKLELPHLKETIAAPKSEDDDATDSRPQFLKLENFPEVTKTWDEFLLQHWMAWAEQDRKDREILGFYERVFDIHQTMQKVAEEYELLLAVGLLAWKVPGGQAVCRHLLTARASITFDTHHAILEVTAPPEGTVYQIEHDMLEVSERPANHHRLEIQEALELANQDSLAQIPLDSFLKTWLNAISARGAYSEEMVPNLNPEEDPRVTFAPALVFRRRTETNMVRLFDEIINNIEETGQLPLGVERLVSIFDDSGYGQADDDEQNLESDNEIYFPLPANADQQEIAEKLRCRQDILVQGPPGTGKSHTISNLVCHLLATGKRILVTSHTPRALSVLRDKFPEDMKALCVSVIGDDGVATRKALEESVSGITSKRNRFNKLHNQRLINELRTRLDSLRQSEAWILNALRSIREKDTYQHPQIFGSYQGTTQAIAQRLAEERSRFDWLESVPSESSEPPLTDREACELLDLCRELSENRVKELSKFIIDSSELPPPEQFTDWLTQLQALKERSSKIAEIKKHPAFLASSKLEESVREELSKKLGDFTNTLQRILNRREEWVPRAVKEVVSDRDRTWRKLLTLTQETLQKINAVSESVQTASVIGIEGKDLTLVRAQAADLLNHLTNKGSLGFWHFRPKPVRDALYLVKQVRVDGHVADRPDILKQLIQWLDIQTSLASLKEAWSSVAEFKAGSIVVQLAEIEDSCEPLEEAVAMHEKMMALRDKLKAIPGLIEPQWDDIEQVTKFSDVLSAGHVEERLDHIGAELQSTLSKLMAVSSNPNAHEVMQELTRSVEVHDYDLYHSSHEALIALESGRTSLQRKIELTRSVAAAAPTIVSELERNHNEPVWDERLSSFVAAWNWARTSTWLQKLSSPSTQQELTEQLATTQADIKSTIAQLAAEMAWGHTFERLSESQNSHLIAWELAMRRVGKGKGKYAEQHRRSARTHMEQCRSSIPAWIMPIHKVVETTKIGGEPFDVVIIDEASQSGPEALFLMYFARQVIVVGDDKQISPEFIGQDREDVNALRDQFLKDLPFSDALGVDHSFFDQAKIRYRGIIRLKEHFRCMPEIIQFSNNLCYGDDPLIPLRQYGAGRITPVIQTSYIQNGYTDDDSNRPVNKPEAEAIVEQIRQCCADPAYDGKTIGVISLLNTSGQAEYIERRFKTGNILTKEEMDERKLRIGDPYVFQGDERDIIFLSMVSAPHREGKKLYPMASAKDERRFNVAASRARDQCWLFHSVTLADLNPKCNRYNLLSYYSNPQITTTEVEDSDIDSLKRKLETFSATSSNPPRPFDSWFEVEVFLRIVDRGYRVIPQFHINGYHIDLVVEGMKGRLAVECDGDAWHGPDRHDEDSARQRDLERCGMQFWRVRGSVFYYNKEKAMEGLWERLEQLKIYPSTTDESYSDSQRQPTEI